MDLQILDWRVLVYFIAENYTRVKNAYGEKTGSAWLKASWVLSLNRGYTGLPWRPHTLAVVDDRNKDGEYWRHAYLRERGFPAYKDGRSKKGDDWFTTQQVGLEYVQRADSEIFFHGFAGYEADDVAAALVRVRGERRIYLHTIDSDWSGMVGPGVTWCDLMHWAPRTRDKAEMMFWCEKKKFKHLIVEPADLWVEKSLHGDKADNLIAGSPLSVIDLFNPPAEHDLLQDPEIKSLLTATAASERLNVSFSHLIQARDYIEAQGLPNALCQPGLCPMNNALIQQYFHLLSPVQQLKYAHLNELIPAIAVT